MNVKMVQLQKKKHSFPGSRIAIGNHPIFGRFAELERVPVNQQLVDIVKKTKRCAIFTMGGIGDHLFALPFIWSLRQSYPDITITNIAVQHLIPSFLLRANIIDEINIIQPPRGLMFERINNTRQLIKLWTQLVHTTYNLRKERLDLSIYLATGLTKKLVLWQFLVGAKTKIALMRENEIPIYKHLVDYNNRILVNEHHIETNLRLAKNLGCDIAEALQCYKLLFERYICHGHLKDNIFIHPFLQTAARDGRSWPLEKFKQVYQYLQQKGFEPTVIGTPLELKSTELNGWENLRIIPLTSLEGSIRLLSGARLVVGNDSAVVHMASLLGVASLSVMCSSDPNFTYPYFNGGIVRVELECSPCFHNKGYNKCKQFMCIEKLTPEQVITHPMISSLL